MIAYVIHIIARGRSICVGHYIECEIFNGRIHKERSERFRLDKDSGIARRICRRLRAQYFTFLHGIVYDREGCDSATSHITRTVRIFVKRNGVGIFRR